MLHLLREEEVGRAVEEWEEKGKGEPCCTSNKQQKLTISHVICVLFVGFARFVFLIFFNRTGNIWENNYDVLRSFSSVSDLEDVALTGHVPPLIKEILKKRSS